MLTFCWRPVETLGTGRDQVQYSLFFFKRSTEIKKGSGHLNSLITCVDICGDHENVPLRSPAVGTEGTGSYSCCPLQNQHCVCAEARLPLGGSEPMTEHSGETNSSPFLQDVGKFWWASLARGLFIVLPVAFTGHATVWGSPSQSSSLPTLCHWCQTHSAVRMLFPTSVPVVSFTGVFPPNLWHI